MILVDGFQGILLEGVKRVGERGFREVCRRD
jgi:hypothetical protein